MSEALNVTGMVLNASPVGEYDKRLILLTKERGKITAFARGARKPNSVLLASTSPFAFGTFTVYEGRNAYTLIKADISNYFREVKEDFEGACYGCYFMEVAEYYTRENLDASMVLNLLYVTLRALSNEKLEKELIRCVYEMKAMILNGEYPWDLVNDPSLMEATRYTLKYILETPMQRLYTFTLSPEVFLEFRNVQDRLNYLHIDREFKSLTILKTLLS